MAEPKREPQSEQEARELRRFLERGAATSVEAVRSFETPRPVTIPLQRPTVVPFNVPTQEVVRALADERTDRAIVELEVAQVARSDEVSALVFVNAPDATIQTSATDPRFVGSIAFFCHTENRGGQFVCAHPSAPTLRYRLDATRALRQASAAVPLTAHVVTVPFPNRAPAVRPLQLAKAKVEVIRSVVRPSR